MSPLTTVVSAPKNLQPSNYCPEAVARTPVARKPTIPLFAQTVSALPIEICALSDSVVNNMTTVLRGINDLKVA